MAPRERLGVKGLSNRDGDRTGRQRPEGLRKRDRGTGIGERGQRTEDHTLGLRGQDKGQKTREEV